MSPSVRLGEFPGENLAVSSGKLFCHACREEIGLKKTIIQQHIMSKKHTSGKGRIQKKEAKERDIAESLKEYDNEFHPKGESLTMEHRVYRVKVVKSFLQAGVPLHKIDCFRELLEEEAFSLTSSGHLSNLVDVISKEEKKKVKEEIQGQDVSIIFDGTTHVAEALNIILRFVTDWKIEQRLVRFLLVTKPMNGEELAHQLLSTLSVEFSIPSGCLLASMRDRASVNNVAIRHLKILYPSLLDIGCFSHTLDHVGEKMSTPTLEKFIKSWISLFAHSARSRIAFKGKTGQFPKSYLQTRWWSKFEMMVQVHDLFGDIPAFVNGGNIAEATARKLQAIVNDPQKLATLSVELSITVDAMRPFVQATYELEGDGYMCLQAFETVTRLQAEMRNRYYPSCNAVVRGIAGDNIALAQQWEAYALACLQPAYDYFTAHFLHGDLQPAVEVFKAARFFNPGKISEIQPTAAEARDHLSKIPFLNTDACSCIDGLQRELPAYIAAAAGVRPDIDVTTWWSQHERELPNWAAACKKVLLIQPSSAASERVFSLLENSFRNNQARAMEDYIEVSLMLQYNKR